MSIQVGYTTECFVCGYKNTAPTEAHVCEWESLFDNRFIYGHTTTTDFREGLKAYVRELIISSYYRGHKDGNLGLTPAQKLSLENLNNRLGEDRKMLGSILDSKPASQ